MFTFLKRRVAAALLLAFASAVGGPRLAMTQSPRHVTVALVDHLPDSAVATIIRSPGAGGQTTILLRERDADAVALASAMSAMYKLREVYGDTVHSRLVVHLYGHRRPGTLLPNEERLAAHYLTRLRNAPTVSLESVGLVRTVEVPVAPRLTSGVAGTAGPLTTLTRP